MAVYFVIGAALVAWALILTFGGMARVRSAPDKRGGRTLMAVSGVLCVAAFAALMATTKKEHPREEAKEKAAEEREAGEQPKGGAIEIAEKEYSIELAGPANLKAGETTFDVVNEGEIPHDLAVEGKGVKPAKTPLIDPGKRAELKVVLDPGKYKLLCTVPGHEQLGMKTTVTAR